MNKVLNINKPIGITSYDVIRQLKKVFVGRKIGHAGTLDPLASGVLVCLVGQGATRRQAEFMGSEKEYEFDVLFGFNTDTYDVLGLITLSSGDYEPDAIKHDLATIIRGYPDNMEQPVPAFSAAKVDGVPLYRHYLRGTLKDVEIPVRTVQISSIEIVDTKILNVDQLQNEIVSLVATVKKGFRQKEVTTGWNEAFKSANSSSQYLVATLKATVSKGTYVRGIAHDLGQKLGIGACTINIKRTRVGEMRLEDAHDLSGFNKLAEENNPKD